MTTSAPIAKLTQGGRSLDLTTGRYRLGPDFVPPSVAITPQLAEGTSANQYGGAKVISTRYNNRRWAFSVDVYGSSEAEVKRAANDVQIFFNRAGDDSNPVYFEYRGNSDTPEAIWGNYSINRKYEIVTGIITIGRMYPTADFRGRAVRCQVSVLVKPFAIGKQQQLVFSKGHTEEDIIGSVDGIAKGLYITETSPTGGNFFTNPVFGYSTFNNGWTSSAALITQKNTDPNFLYPGTENSAELVNGSNAATAIYQSITLTAATHMISFYAKRRDGSAITAGTSDLMVWYNGAGVTSTAASLGNGWYRIYATVTGTGGAAQAGARVGAYKDCYVTAFLAELRAYLTPFYCGDFLGCSWGAGGAHNDVSSRTVAPYQRIPLNTTNMRWGAFTIRLVWRPMNGAAQAANRHLFLIDGTRQLQCFVTATTDTLSFRDGTTTITTAAQTITAETPIIIHAVYGDAGQMVIYFNGTSIGTNTYTPPTGDGAYCYIGSSATPSTWGHGTMMGFEIIGEALTAAEVTSDYTNVVQVINDGQRLGTIPGLWTYAGAGVVHNGLDDSASTGFPHRNYAVGFGIPGSLAAQTEFNINPISGYIYAGLWSPEYFTNPLYVLYHEQSGTAGAVTDSTANYKTTSTGTSAVTIGSSTVTLNKYLYKKLQGLEFYGVARLDDGTLQTLSLSLVITVGTAIYSDYKSISNAGAITGDPTIQITNPITAPLIGHFSDEALTIVPNFQLYGKRSSGTVNVLVDYFCIFPRPFAYWSFFDTNGGYVSGQNIRSFSGANALTGPVSVLGDTIEFIPNRVNVLLNAIAGSSTTIQDTVTYSKVIVTPRYALL